MFKLPPKDFHLSVYISLPFILFSLMTAGFVADGQPSSVDPPNQFFPELPSEKSLKIESPLHGLDYTSEIKGQAAEIKFRNFPIKRIKVTEWNDSATLEIDTFDIEGSVQAYAINPIGIESAEVTAVAKGEYLYKCKEWNFTERKCYGEWVQIMRLTPGQSYTFLLDSADPALAEFSGSFFDGFESGSFATNNWTTSGPGNPWTVSTTLPYQGTYDAEAKPLGAPTYLTVNISTAGYSNITFSYYRRLTGLDATDAFNASYYNGSAWVIVEQISSVDDATYFNRNFTLPASAANNPLFAVRFGCTANQGNEYCRVDNVNVSGIGSPPNTTLVSPANGNVTLSRDIDFTCNATDALGLRNITFYWNYSGTWQANGTANVSGTSNETTFSRTGLNDSSILWNCYACNLGGLCSFASANWTVTVTTPPNITFINPTPPNGTVISQNWIYVNISSSKPLSTARLEWNGTNETMSGSGTNWYLNKTGLGYGNYSYKVYGNDTYNYWNVSETRTLIYGTPPIVIIVEPYGQVYDQHGVVPITVNATDPDGINITIATVTYPNGTMENITLVYTPFGDDFESNTTGIGWRRENISTGPSQTCVANVNGTVPGKAYTSLSGDGSPLTDTLCSLISSTAIYGDFDMNVSFEILDSPGVDNAINFQITKTPTSARTARYAFIALSNWTGLGRNYEVFVDDGINPAGYIAARPTDDTYGKFRMRRIGDNFTFYTWNNSAGSWILENSSIINFSTAVFITMEAETVFPGWGSINASWDNLSIFHYNYSYNVFNSTNASGLYNVSIYSRDNLGAVNDSEKTNFTIMPINDPPSTPFLLTPYPDARIYEMYNITWSQVVDEEDNNVQFNITLLNPDYSHNTTIVSDYGNLSTVRYELNTSQYADGTYSLRILVFENETAEHLSNSHTLSGTFEINNTQNQPPEVVILEPLGGNYSDMKPVPIAANITDIDGINETYATVTYPNGTQENLTLYQYPAGDNFNFNTVGIAWRVENISVGPSQTCTANINGTIPGKAYTSISGDGSPLTDTQCSLVSMHPIYADFDMNVSFEILASPGVDNAINFQVSEISSSANASTLAFIALSNWTGLGRNYELFVDDGNISDYIATVPTNDTSGKFRIKRNGSYFSFYVWNNTGSSWIELNSTNLSFNNVLYITMESESAYPEWGWVNASWEDLQIEHDNSYVNVFNTRVHPVGDYNVSFYARDNRGAVNNTEKSNFTIVDINNPPSKPFILTPYPGQAIAGLFNITWTGVSDPDGDSVQFNITLLNADGSDNDTIASNYGNISTVRYEWDTTAFPDGEYSMRVDVFENETAEELSNSYTLSGTFIVHNIIPSVIVITPLGENYTAEDPVAISANITSSYPIASAIAEITLPNSTRQNITLGASQQSDDFETDTMGTNWSRLNTSLGPSQTCIADIDTSISGKAYTYINGSGSPRTDSYCCIVSSKAIDGDFDISISFEKVNSSGLEDALVFAITSTPSTPISLDHMAIILSNWTGYGTGYTVAIKDGNFSGVIGSRQSDDTYGKMRITRTGNNFTFYSYNNTKWFLDSGGRLLGIHSAPCRLYGVRVHVRISWMGDSWRRMGQLLSLLCQYDLRHVQ